MADQSSRRDDERAEKAGGMKYEMKDLGYKRKETSALLRVEMSDGTRWDVPVQVIADSRDEHYREDEEDTIDFIHGGGLGDFEIYDWAGNNMNWSDVSQFAVRAPDATRKKIDWEDGWANGEKEIIGTL